MKCVFVGRDREERDEYGIMFGNPDPFSLSHTHTRSRTEEFQIST